MMTLFCILVGSWVLSLVLTPLARRYALRSGLVDCPDNHRKTHRQPIPRAGGLAVLASTVLVLLIALVVPNPLGDVLAEKGIGLFGLLLASIIIAAVGVADDYGCLRGRHKLLGQLVAVLVMIPFGVEVQRIGLFGWQIDLGMLAIPFTCIWLLGAINSLNLIDGMDGLLGSIGFILSAALAGMALIGGDRWGIACVAVALAGSLLGFLRYNLPPATIFLGDAGSMLIGLIVGTLAIEASLKGPAMVAMAAPTALLAIPFLDTFAAIVRRKLTGRSIYTTDRGHLHHCLLARGLSNRRALLLVAGCCLLTVSGALVSVALKQELIALFAAGAVIGMLIVTHVFGYTEFVLLWKRVDGLARSLMRGPKVKPRQMEVRLQGNLDWSVLWQNLLARAPWLNLKMVQLNVNAPVLHECYHARWDSGHEQGEEHHLWRAEIPLTVHGTILGRLEILGESDEESTSKKVAAVVELVEEFEAAASDMIGSGPHLGMLAGMKAAPLLEAGDVPARI